MRRGSSGDGLGPTRRHVEGISRRAEELLQVGPAGLIGLQGRRGGDDAELRGVGAQPDPVEEPPKQQGDLRAGRPPEGVELVDHQGEDGAGLLAQPGGGTLEHLLLVLPHEHDVEHGVVGDEQVRGRGEEVLTVHHFVATRIAEEVELLALPLRGDQVVLLLQLADLLGVLSEAVRGHGG